MLHQVSTHMCSPLCDQTLDLRESRLRPRSGSLKMDLLVLLHIFLVGYGSSTIEFTVEGYYASNKSDMVTTCQGRPLLVEFHGTLYQSE